MTRMSDLYDPVTRVCCALFRFSFCLLCVHELGNFSPVCELTTSVFCYGWSSVNALC